MKIFEEDFQRERSDRERMNEEKEELKQQLEKLQKQLVLSNNQVRSTGCCGQHPRRRLVSPQGMSEILVPSVMASVPILELPVVTARASPFTHLFLLPLSWESDVGGNSADIPMGHHSIPCPTDEEGDRVSSALIPPFSQLRASKEDCQREKEEKEKLKKLLKQHKQVHMGGKPFLGRGAVGPQPHISYWRRSSELGHCGVGGLPSGLSPASPPAPCRLLERGCTLSHCRGHWALPALCTSTSTVPPWLTPCATALMSGSRSDTRQRCRASTRRGKTSTTFPR